MDIFEETWRALRGEPGGRHRWLGEPQAVPASEHGPRHSIDTPTEEMVLWRAMRTQTGTAAPTTD